MYLWYSAEYGSSFLQDGNGSGLLSFFKNNKENRLTKACDFVAAKIYLPDEKILPWAIKCRHEFKNLFDQDLERKDLFRFQNRLDQLHVSHLKIYTPSEVEQIWTEKRKTTGIKSEFIDGLLIVTSVLPNSPAEKKGIRMGDHVLSIDAETADPQSAEKLTGVYELRRKQITSKIKIEAIEMKEDQSAQFKILSRRAAILKVPSFRAEYFSDEKMKILSSELLKIQTNLRSNSSSALRSNSSSGSNSGLNSNSGSNSGSGSAKILEVGNGNKKNRLIIDLRKNAGGNFVAGLRFLSLFLDPKEKIGSLERPRFANEKISILSNEIDDEKQLAMIESSSAVELQIPALAEKEVSQVKTPQMKAPRIKAIRQELDSPFTPFNRAEFEIIVLVDHATASTAEMVAQALLEFRDAKIFGSVSSGQLLVGTWYASPQFGKGVKISIPEALYKSAKGKVIEGEGVRPDRVLYMNKEDFENGVDTWISKSISEK